MRRNSSWDCCRKWIWSNRRNYWGKSSSRRNWKRICWRRDRNKVSWNWNCWRNRKSSRWKFWNRRDSGRVRPFWKWFWNWIKQLRSCWRGCKKLEGSSNKISWKIYLSGDEINWEKVRWFNCWKRCKNQRAWVKTRKNTRLVMKHNRSSLTSWQSRIKYSCEDLIYISSSSNEESHKQIFKACW